MDAETAPTRIIADRYEILGVLGQGGTGIVYDAVTPDGAAIALKVIHQELAGDAQIRGRFRREAAILRRLEGDHVCPIVDFGEVDGETPGTTLLYIALPKIEGESLADVLAKELLDVDRAIDILLEVLAALRTAHDQGVIHRDLKPANVLLASSGTSPEPGEQRRRERAVVVDFGMAKIITGTGMDTTNLTTHNMIFGTPEYMSPEQARGDELDARCDVYAAGIILYEMLTGAPPFTGDSPLTVLTAHLTSDLEPPSSRAPQRVSPALDAVVVHALARDGQGRYVSAAELASAIQRARAAPDDVDAVRPAAHPPARNPYPSNAIVVDQDAVDPTAATLAGAAAPRLSSLPLPRPRSSPSPNVTRGEGRALPSVAPFAARSSGVSKRWIATWVVVAAASVAVGVWIALHR